MFYLQGWRWSYFIAAIPGIVVGVLLFLTVKDPPKQQTRQQTTDSTGQIQTQGLAYKAKRVFTQFFNPSVILLCLASSVRNSGKRVDIDSPLVGRGLRYFSTRSELKKN